VSYGLTSAAGQVFGPFALPQNYTCDQTGQMLTDAVNAADSTVDFTQFTRIALVYPAAISCTYGAQDTLGCWTVPSPSKGNMQESVGWFRNCRVPSPMFTCLLTS